MITIDEASQIIAEKVACFSRPPLVEIDFSHKQSSNKKPYGNYNKRNYLGHLQHVLAEDIYSRIDVPEFANSAMDGYVFYRRDIQLPSSFIAVDSREAAAGKAPFLLPLGFCCRIYTGAPLPFVFDDEELLIVPIENCQENKQESVGNSVRVLPGPLLNHVRPKGQNYCRGELVASKGAVCTPELFSVLASVGQNLVNVYRPLSLALCVSGDELVEAGRSHLQIGQIYDSNSIYLAYQCSQLGWQSQVIYLKDDYRETKKQLRELAENFDVVLCSGGASVGERDFIRKVVLEEGEIYIRKVAIKPGKPFTFANFYGKPLFCLPGNPLSAYISFLYFVLPFLRRLQGQQEGTEVHLERAVAPCEFTSVQRSQFVFCRRRNGIIEVLAEQSSALLKYLYLADGALLIPAGIDPIRKGQELAWFSFRGQLLS